MKKLLMKISLVVALFGSGFAVNEMIHDNEVKATTQFPTPIQEMAKEEGFNLATIPSDKDNIFTQYFTIKKVWDNVVEAENTFYKYDIVFLEKTDFDNVELKEGVKIAVTYNHDTVVTVEKAEQEPKEQTQPPAPITQEKPVTTQEYTITEDTQNKLVHAENGNEKAVLENDNYKKGDKIKVTYGNSGAHDDIKKQEKVMSDEDKAYKDAFEENAKTDINRNNPNYVQTEDGSFVPKNFWD